MEPRQRDTYVCTEIELQGRIPPGTPPLLSPPPTRRMGVETNRTGSVRLDAVGPLWGAAACPDFEASGYWDEAA